MEWARICLCAFVSAMFGMVKSQGLTLSFVQAPPLDDADMIIILDECDRRYATNDTIAHYVSVPGDCSAFVMCEVPSRGPEVVLCPAGLFFNDDLDVQTCVRPVNSNCQGTRGDPCVARQNGYVEDKIRSRDYQAAYYTCRNGVTVGGDWCALGEQYLSPEVACTPLPVGFPVPSISVPRKVPTPCRLKAVPGNNRMFNLGGSDVLCAGNLIFSEQSCGCVWPW